MVKKNIYLLTLAVLICFTSVSKVQSQNIPDRPNPPRLVNDFAGMLSSGEVNSLEQKLVAFNDSTSTQIAIVTVSTLDGYAVADYAQRLGEKWGIGQKGKNNGLLILVKPKTSDSNGAISIATGYGAEGAAPDMVCAEIIDYEIVPAFRNGDYFGGLNKATSTLMSLVKGEFSADDYGQRAHRTSGKKPPIGIIIIMIVIVIALVSKRSGGSNNRHIGSGSLPFWMLMGMMGSGGSHSGSWGGFSGGSSQGGGFGGFGGGSFGGGGASGSW